MFLCMFACSLGMESLAESCVRGATLKDIATEAQCKAPRFMGGVLFGCFASNIDGDSWFTWWFNHLPGKPIYFPQKDTA